MLARPNLFNLSNAGYLPDCAPEFHAAYIVFIIDGVNKELIESWVKNVAKESGQKADWGYVAGRACVKGIGDFEKIRAAMKALLPELNRAKQESYDSRNYKMSATPYTAQDVDNQIDKVLEAIKIEQAVERSSP